MPPPAPTRYDSRGRPLNAAAKPGSAPPAKPGGAPPAKKPGGAPPAKKPGSAPPAKKPGSAPYGSKPGSGPYVPPRSSKPGSAPYVPPHGSSRPGQPLTAAQRDALKTPKQKAEAAKQKVEAARTAEAEPFTIPGQEDTRVAFQKAQKRAPTKAEQAMLKNFVSVAKTAMENQAEANFLGVLLRFQFYLAKLAAPRGKDVEAINAKVNEAMKRNAWSRQFVMISPSGAEGTDDRRGWRWANFSTLDHFMAVQKREPTEAEQKILLKFVKAADAAKARGGSNDEEEFDTLHHKATFFSHNLREPRHADLEKIRRGSAAFTRKHVLEYYANKPKGILGELSEWGHAISKGLTGFLALPGINILAESAGALIHGAATLYKGVTDLVDKVPFIGSGIHSALNLAGGNIIKDADAISRGANISQTALAGLKENLSDASSVASYVTIVTSLVPGIGQVGAGILGALAAANALAQGQSITDSLINAAEQAAMAAIPGGSVGNVVKKVAAEAIAAAKALMSGDSLDQVALDRIRAQLPAEAQKALDVTVALAHGKKLQDIVVDNVKQFGADQLGKLASRGGELLAHSPALQQAAKDLKGTAESGFKLATGTLAHTGISPAALAALRDKLDPSGKVGFDKAISIHSAAAKLGKTAQNTITKNVKNLAPPALQKIATAGDILLKQSPTMQKGLNSLTDKAARDGFKYATGVIASKTPPKAMAEFRNKLSAAARQGFDKAVTTHTMASSDLRLSKRVTALPPQALQQIAARGDAKVKKSPGLQKAASTLKTKPAQDGFKLAAGVLSTRGKSPPPKTLAAISKKLKPEARKGFDAAVAIHKATTGPSSAALQQVASRGDAFVQKSPALQKAASSLKTKPAQDGFKLATGVLSTSRDITPKTLDDYSSKLKPEAKKGFDAAVAAHATIPAPRAPTPALPSYAEEETLLASIATIPDSTLQALQA